MKNIFQPLKELGMLEICICYLQSTFSNIYFRYVAAINISTYYY